MIIILSYLRSSILNLDPRLVPKACVRSLISWLVPSFELAAPSTFKIFPLNGKSACVFLSLAIFAEPPALSPSTINNSVPSRVLSEQSTSFPGNRSRLVADFRAVSFSCLRRSLSSARNIRKSKIALADLLSEASQLSK